MRSRISFAASIPQPIYPAAVGLAIGRRFLAFTQDQRIDSLVFQGLLGTPAGAIYRFSYDSAPCGGPECAGQFVITRCERPFVITSSGQPGGTFGCRLSDE